jgi:hypothetical protein
MTTAEIQNSRTWQLGSGDCLQSMLIVLTHAIELREREARYGVLGVCVGSGQGVALVLENPSEA